MTESDCWEELAPDPQFQKLFCKRTRVLYLKPLWTWVTSCCVLTVKGLQVHSESTSLAVAFATFPTHVRSVTGVCPYVPWELDGLSKDSLTILAHIHLPWKQGNTITHKKTRTHLYFVHQGNMQCVSYLLSASSWCGMRVQLPHWSSCHSAGSGMVSLQYAAACDFSKRSLHQTLRHIPRRWRASRQSALSVCGTPNLKNGMYSGNRL